MTFRAVLLGLIAAAVLAGVTYFNDFILRQSHFVGSFLPISVFGGLIIFTVMINPLLGRIRRSFPLRAGELAVIVAIVFAACYVPGRGLMHYFTTLQMLPHWYQKQSGNLTWRNEKIVELAPERMLADPRRDPKTALDGFVTGLGKDDRHIGLGDVPWYAWQESLAFWIPLLLSILIGMIGLSLVLHRQWAHHERLRYPIAMFANALLPQRGHAVSSMLRNRAFWFTAGAIVCIHSINYANLWYPGVTIEIPVKVDLRAIGEMVPTFAKWGSGADLLIVRLYFAAVGFAYLLSTDISVSVGVAPYLFTYVAGIFAIRGIPLREGLVPLQLSIETFLHAGAYFGMFLVLIYIGRRYYFTALRRSLFLPVREQAPTEAVWGMRVFLLGAVLFAAQLTLVGLDWQLAALYTFGTVMVFVVLSRIVAETGLYYLHSYTFPCIVLWGFLGPTALGPKMLLIMMIVTSALLIDPREAVLPFMINALRITDANKVRTGKVAVWAVVALLVAFAVAIPATLYLQYDYGTQKASDPWSRYVPYFGFNQVANLQSRMRESGDLAASQSLSGWQRFAQTSPSTRHVVAFGAAMGLVLLFTAARLRSPRWPLHPVMFLVLATHQIRFLAASFLLGGLIKVAVTKLFGGKVYEKLKPAMFGLVAGDMLGGIVTMIVGAIYYAGTGLTPKTFMILPY